MITSKNSDNNSSSSHSYFSTDHLKYDLKKRSVRGGSITIFARAANNVIQIAGTVILARILTPYDFGLVAMVTAITGFGLIFRDLGLTDATIQKAEIDHKLTSTLFWINVSFSISVALLIIVLAPLIAWFYGEPKLKWITIISSLSFIFTGFSIQHLALLKRNMSYAKIAVVEISGMLFSSIIGVFFAWYGWGYWALVIRHITLALFTTMGVWFIFQWRPGLPTYHPEVKSMFMFGANISGRYFVNYFSTSLDKILIGWRYGANNLGFYSKAFQLYTMISSQLAVPLHSVATPALSRLRDEPEKFRRYYINALSTITFATLPIIVFLVIMSSDIILFLLGPQWNETSEIFFILGIRASIQFIYSSQGWLHVSLGRADRWLKWTSLATFITVIAIFLGLPFGPKGVAISYTLSFFLIVGPGLSYAGKPIDLKFIAVISSLWRYFMAALGVGFLCWFLFYSFELTSSIFIKFNIISRLSLSFISCVLIYLLSIIALYQNTKPIVNFLSLIADMMPKVSMKNI